MSENSKIEWCDASWNPIRALNMETGKVGWHCERISPGCKNCYACGMNKRLGTGLDYSVPVTNKVKIFLDLKAMALPLKWRKPKRIFVCSMTDLFARFVSQGTQDEVVSEMIGARKHEYMVLTKRAKECVGYFLRFRPDGQGFVTPGGEDAMSSRVCANAENWPPRHIRIGFSAENQQYFDERWSEMRKLAAAGWRVYCSAEPLLGPINARQALAEGLEQIIVGGESGGARSRPMHPDWARKLRNQCVDAKVPFFFKQWGEWQNGSGFSDKAKTVLCDGRVVGDPKDCHIDTQNNWPNLLPTMMLRVGKKKAGRLLDGREWSEFPV